MKGDRAFGGAGPAAAAPTPPDAQTCRLKVPFSHWFTHSYR